MRVGTLWCAAVSLFLLLPNVAGIAPSPHVSRAPNPPQVGSSDPDGAYVDPVLVQQLRDEPWQIAILVLDSGKEAHVLADLQAHGDIHHPYPMLHQVALYVTPKRVDELSRLDGVTTIYHNEIAKPYLDRSAAYIGANILWKTYGVRGKEADGTPVGVMIVDTGIDGTHPDVRFGVNLKENVMPTRMDPSSPVGGLIGGSREGVVNSDGDGHGTHVAGIAASLAVGGGANDAGKYRGIAYESILIGFAAGVIDPATNDASFQSVTVLEAFDYALKKKDVHNLRVISNSWGANGPFDPSSPVVQATLTLYRAGLVVTFAAGNEGEQGEGSLNKYSVAPWVLSVAGGNYLNQRASFSSIGSTKHPYDHPDIMAPGVQITSAKAATGTTGLLGSATQVRTAYYVTKSGTSMATPHVSGVAALLAGFNPKLSPDEIMDVLVASSTPLPNVPLHEGGAGYLNAVDAYKLAETLPGNLDAFLGGLIKYGGRFVGDNDYSEDPVSVGLGRAPARPLSGLAGVQEFAYGLVSTAQGVFFIVGTVLLTLLAFRFRREGWD